MDLAHWLLFAAWLIAISNSFLWARRYFKLKKAFKNLSEIQTWAQTSFPGRRYHEDGGYTGGKTCIETDLELKMARARMEIEMRRSTLFDYCPYIRFEGKARCLYEECIIRDCEMQPETPLLYSNVPIESKKEK